MPGFTVIKMMDKKINSTVYAKVLNELLNLPLSVSPSEEMGDHRTQKKKKKKISDLGGNRTHDVRI